MTPVWFLARCWLRRSWATTLLLGVLVMIVAGGVLAALAGARREASALDRFLTYNRPSQVQVYGEPGVLDLDAVEALPQVVGAARGSYGLLSATGPNGETLPVAAINPFITIRTTGERSSRPFVVRGTLPALDDARAASIDEEASERLGAGVGDMLRLELYEPDQLDAFEVRGGQTPPPHGRTVEVEVEAIVRHPFDLNPIAPPGAEFAALGSADLHLGPGFWEAYGDQMAGFGGEDDGVDVLLRNGPEDFTAFEAAIRDLTGGGDANVELRSDSEEAVATTRDALRFEAITLAIFGALLALAGVAIVGQTLSRQVRANLSDQRLLAAMGCGRSMLIRAAVLRTLPVAGIATAGAVATAWVLSARTPIGLGRRAEVDPGMRFDLTVLVPGALVVGLAVVGWTAFTAWRATTGHDRAPSGDLFEWVARRAALSGAPVSFVLGLSQLSSGRRRGARAPVRSGLGAVSIACAGVIAIVVFATSLDRLISEPLEQGWRWDAIVGDSEDAGIDESEGWLADNPDVAGYASVWTTETDDSALVGTTSVDLVGIDSLAGEVYPRLLTGDVADEPDEIVLGSETLDSSGRAIGDEVEVTAGDRRARFRIVGEVQLTEWIAGPLTLDEGGVVTSEGYRGLYGDELFIARFLVDYADDVPIAEATASVREDFGRTVIPPLPPVDIWNLGRVVELPAALAIAVALLGLATLVHLLVLAVRRGRSDLAILAALGVRRRQLGGIIATMATAVGVAALVLGLPVGVAVGRLVWRLVAEGVGSSMSPITPAAPVALLVLTVLLAANVVAAATGRRAIRGRPAAEMLRAE